MKTKGLVKCYICKKMINVKNAALIGSHWTCKTHKGVAREMAREEAGKETG